MLLTKIIKIAQNMSILKKVLSRFRVMLAKQDGFDWHGHTQNIVRGHKDVEIFCASADGSDCLPDVFSTPLRLQRSTLR